MMFEGHMEKLDLIQSCSGVRHDYYYFRCKLSIPELGLKSIGSFQRNGKGTRRFFQGQGKGTRYLSGVSLESGLG